MMVLKTFVVASLLVCVGAISTILPSWLYLGNKMDARDLGLLQLHKITHILNAAKELPKSFPGDMIYSMSGRIVDHPQYRIDYHFGEAIAFIVKARNADGRVLVHCAAGISRSATFVIAYLMTIEKMSLVNAYYLVQRSRPIIQPNAGFMRHLHQLDIALAPNRGPSTLPPGLVPNLPSLMIYIECRYIVYSGISLMFSIDDTATINALNLMEPSAKSAAALDAILFKSISNGGHDVREIAIIIRYLVEKNYVSEDELVQLFESVRICDVIPTLLEWMSLLELFFTNPISEHTIARIHALIK